MLFKFFSIKTMFLVAVLLAPAWPGRLCAQEQIREEAQMAEPDHWRGKFTIEEQAFSVWNGEAYVPIFIKGINMGVSVPGTQPGELAASREDYRRWFKLIREAGYNTIRLYTLHFPRFYEELRAFNLENPREPLLVMHGIWLEEQAPLADLHLMTEDFDQEMREDVAAAHGDIIIEHRFGKAYGEFTADISPWVLAWLPGREIYPDEVALTNEADPGSTSFTGNWYSLPEGDPVEVWLTKRIESLAEYEYSNYGMLRPIGFSSWPTLDPIYHPTEHELIGSSEDQEQIDLANMQWSKDAGGFYMAYHAYPYYPDFIVQDPVYNLEADQDGPNNYLGYLKDLKAHYMDIPLLVGEFGVPSSWGSGHHSPSGMHHGGHSEEEQGQIALRMLGNLQEAGFAGGLQFSLIDEWFKQTWITNPLSDRDYRHFWHNITSPEQNFGIITYMPPPEPFTTVAKWSGRSISEAQTHADYTFFRVRLFLNTEEHPEDTLWLALDTYEAELGESMLPDGRSIGGVEDTLRAEFLLRIPLGGDEADLLVLPSYDIYGVKQMDRSDTVVSESTDMGKWNPVRWKNNYFYDQTQYIGKIRISDSDEPYQFLNGISRYRDSLEIRLPWTLINYPAPSVRRVMHYLGHMQGGDVVVEQRDSLSEGIAFSMVLGDELYQADRYSWAFWDHEKIFSEEHAPLERKKESFFLLREGLPQFNSPPVALADTFRVEPGESLELSGAEGLMMNDFDVDGNPMEVLMAFGSGCAHGEMALHPDGGFTYQPESAFRGSDGFTYYLDDGRAYSTLTRVHIDVDYPSAEIPALDVLPSIYPNPASGHIYVRTGQSFANACLQVYDLTGRELGIYPLNAPTERVDVQGLKAGVYLFILTIDQKRKPYRIILR